MGEVTCLEEGMWQKVGEGLIEISKSNFIICLKEQALIN